MRRVVIALAIACSAPPAPVTPERPHPVAVVPDAAPDAPPPPLDRDPTRLAARAVDMMRAGAPAFADRGEDRGAAAAKLDAIRSDFADLLAANAAMLADGRRGELKAAIAPRQADLDAAATAVFGAKV